MPISSLPSKFGTGTLGREAYDFVDFLKSCKQEYWQILPNGPTGFGDSPYQSFSAYAGNPYWVDLEILADEKLLTHTEIKKSGFKNDPDFIDYGDLYEKRFALLEKAAARVKPFDEEFLAFCADNAEWLDDFALFMALKDENGMAAFALWPREYRIYNGKKLIKIRERLREKIHSRKVVQYLFYKQWKVFKNYANKNGIKIIGDIPIYVSPDSSDLWANHRLFQIDKNREMIFIAGCPPDYFNETGQRWGNPLYNWNYHKKQEYEWWIKRIRHAGELFDVVRIDHFRGFAGYYSIPATCETAEIGEWRKGPGKNLISAFKEKVPELMIIAEDLGFMTPEVRRLLKFSGYPGMKVLQFAFDGSEKNEYLPHKYNVNSIVYTGTHDNTTLRGWIKTAEANEIKFAKKYLNIRRDYELADAIIKVAMESKSEICIIPIQDWLGLGEEARINTPGTDEGNWRFRVRKRALSEKLADKILKITEESGRL